METPPISPDPLPEEPKKSNTTLIIAVVAVVVLCCCCIALGILWQYGDQLLRAIQGG